MPAIILPHEWRRQPPNHIRPDWGNPLARRLELLSTPVGSGKFYDAVGKRFATHNNGTGVSAADNSTVCTFDGTDDNVRFLTPDTITSVLPWSLWFRARHTGTPGLVNLFNFGATVAIGYWWNSGNGFLAERLMNNTANATELSSPVVITNWHDWCFTWDGTSARLKIYVDGVDKSAPGSAGVNLDLFAGLDLSRGPSGLPAPMHVSMVACWSRELQSREIARIAENRWQLFRPLRRRLFVSAAISGDVSVTLTGVSAAGAVGDLTVEATADAAVTLSEVSAASAVGTLAADLTETETLTPVSAAGNVNDLTVSVSFDADVTLTGLSAAGAVNDLTADMVGDALSVTLTGVSAAAAVGTLSVTSDTADSVSLAGVSAASAVGTLDATSTQALSETLSGVNATADVNSLTADVSAADALGTVSAQAEVGNLTAEVSSDATVTLTGVTAAAAVADLSTDLSLHLEVELTGVSAVGNVRDLIIPIDEPLIDEEIRDALKHLVRGNVHPLRRPQRTTQEEANAHLPEIVYTIVSDDWEQAETLCGVGLHVTRVQLDVYAQHYREARAYAYAVAKEMDAIGWRMNMQPFPDDDEKIYRWQLEYSCWRNEVPPSLPLTSVHRGR